MKNTKAIIFDMDGVLIDSEPFWGQASMEVMQRVGIPYTRDDVMRYQGVRIGDIVSRVWDENPISFSKQEHDSSHNILCNPLYASLSFFFFSFLYKL